MLPLVRAILSWEIVPDPNSPDQAPIWGDVHECHIQIRPRRFIFLDVLGSAAGKVAVKLPPLRARGAAVADPGPRLR